MLKRNIPDVEGRSAATTEITPGAMVGELEVLADQKRRATLTAVQACEFLRIDGDTVLDLVSENAALSRDMLSTIATRVVAAA